MVSTKGSQPGGADRRLQDLGIQVPAAPTPFGPYVETMQTGNLLFFSGMLPVIDHKPASRLRIWATDIATSPTQSSSTTRSTRRRAFWADRPAYEELLRKNLLSLATTKTLHIGDGTNIELYDPDLWTDEYAFLNGRGQAQNQSDLFYYPKWKASLQKMQPKLLVLYGKHDLSFGLGKPTWDISHSIPKQLRSRS
jgi:hypothetical protein